MGFLNGYQIRAWGKSIAKARAQEVLDLLPSDEAAAIKRHPDWVKRTVGADQAHLNFTTGEITINGVIIPPREEETTEANNVVRLPTPEPEPECVALECIDEILSYAPAEPPHREPGEIDPDALRNEYFDTRNEYERREIWDALEFYVVWGHRNPLNHLPTTTPGYTRIVKFLREFELRPREVK